MEEIKRQGLCIRSIDYKDNDKLITIYAFGEGKILANCRGVKKPKSKLRYASNIFCFGDYILMKSNGYYTVKTCDMIESFYDICYDIDKYYPALASIEILDKLSGDHEIADDLATLVLEFLRGLLYDKVDNIEIEFARFLMKVLAMSGYAVSTQGCAVCGATEGSEIYFSNQYGGVVYECCSDEYATAMNMEQYCLLQDLNKNYRITEAKKSDVNKIISLLIGYVSYSLSVNLNACKEYVQFLAQIC